LLVKLKDKHYHLKVAGFIANRIAFDRSGGKKSFSRFIIRLSIVATVISVAVMIITLAFANGFQASVSQKVFSFWGHIRVQEKQPDKSVIAEEIPILMNDTLVMKIRQNPEVKSIHPFATRYAILKTKDEIEGVLVKGLDNSYDFKNFQSFIKEGRKLEFNDSSYSREIMISEFTAKQLELKLNERILIYFIRPDGTLRPDKLTITGIYRTGIEEYDKTFAIGDIKLIQRLNEWKPSEIGGYEIFLNDYEKIDPVIDQIIEIDELHPELSLIENEQAGDTSLSSENYRRRTQSLDAISAKDISPNIFDWLNMQDVTRNVLIGFMIAVAVINLITCLIILVLERIKMIGILKALGATDWTVQKIFLRHSAIITITGILVGTAIALGVLFLQQETGFIKLKEEAYYLSEAAVKIIWWQVAAICIGTLLVCFLILMIPSILVRKVQPVKAIHFR
jgi:lipoprotein-releasing system permease protein